MPQSIWIMQDRAELASSKNVIVEVRKGNEGILIHVPFKLSVLSAAPAQNQGAGPATRRVYLRTGFEPSTGLFLDVERAIPVYLRHSQPAVKENAQKR
jgi:hypothetical protein